MGDHRLFVAVMPPVDVVDALLAQRGPDADGVRWTPPSQWHVTLLFTPVVPDELVAPFADGLRGVAAATGTFDLAVRGGGAFPEMTRARHLVAMLDDETGSLPRLNAGCRAVADRLGLDHRAGDYQPHLTLARLNRPQDRSADADWLSAIGTGRWRVGDIALVESVLDGPNHTARHSVLERLPLAADPTMA